MLLANASVMGSGLKFSSETTNGTVAALVEMFEKGEGVHVDIRRASMYYMEAADRLSPIGLLSRTEIEEAARAGSYEVKLWMRRMRRGLRVWRRPSST